ncbi:PLP-dependent aminotransferase family protein [Shewanella sp. GD03713]|uniref:MocR-like pyridoxine biosynthesis transcription factor PdxR n=1 Tax=Shewanella sp. GD03713 TaxID=2975372 RepID=UPI000F70C6BB|nr:PLP-dependent aminotransferase family protein [Shewanella sp. GD03713]MDH1471201.1 PLP-dependent aminotransferase family protein [Shewanella sp. GD03713]QXN26167.1 PLP-dependent aminotransferase family protein [Shewanella putrefaciens]VEE60817.1 HTH-type transcriptional regulatory protein gabR [Shewanella putrefaciens]
MSNTTDNQPQPVQLYRQIYQRFRDAIANGNLEPGDRVPSIRALASEMNLARGTVETAYQLLISEGYFVARGPAGTIVCPRIKPAELTPQPITPPVVQTALLHTGELPKPLQLGLPALDAFPSKLWHRLAARAMRQSQVQGLICADARGDASLRAAIAGYLGISRGISCSPEQVFVVAGYRAGLDLICRSLLNVGDSCLVENPGYFAAHDFMREAGANLVPVPVDQDGMVVDEGLKSAPDARFAIVTPAHQSPLCVSLSMARRQALLAWAKAQESWIIEDDYDGEYRYQGRPLAPLKSLDAYDRVLYCGTFSKVLVPGLRLAYLVVPVAQIPRFTEVIGKMHSHCPPLWQVTTAQFIEQGHFARHLKKMRSLYSTRRSLLIDALTETFGERLRIDRRTGGMHIVVRLADGTNDKAVSLRAKSAGLSMQALSNWYISDEVEQGWLLGFTNVNDRTQALALAQQLALIIDEQPSINTDVG